MSVGKTIISMDACSSSNSNLIKQLKGLLDGLEISKLKRISGGQMEGNNLLLNPKNLIITLVLEIKSVHPNGVSLYS